MFKDNRKDFSVEAREAFVRLVERHGIEGSFYNEAPVEVLFEIPKQVGLDFDITLCLQNMDELWVWVADCSFCTFPYDMHGKYFIGLIDGLISGTNRIIKYHQGPWNWNYMSIFQEPDGPNWVYGLGEGSKIFKLPFLRISTQIIMNQGYPEAD